MKERKLCAIITVVTLGELSFHHPHLSLICAGDSATSMNLWKATFVFCGCRPTIEHFNLTLGDHATLSDYKDTALSSISPSVLLQNVLYKLPIFISICHYSIPLAQKPHFTPFFLYDSVFLHVLEL